MKSSALIKPYLIENRSLIVIGLISLIIVDVLQLFIPRVIKWVVDDLTTFQTDMPGLLKYSLYLAGIGLLIGAMYGVAVFWEHRDGWRKDCAMFSSAIFKPFQPHILIMSKPAI